MKGFDQKAGRGIIYNPMSVINFLHLVFTQLSLIHRVILPTRLKFSHRVSASNRTRDSNNYFLRSLSAASYPVPWSLYKTSVESTREEHLSLSIKKIRLSLEPSFKDLKIPLHHWYARTRQSSHCRHRWGHWALHKQTTTILNTGLT